MREATQCEVCVRAQTAPEGFTREAQANHPTYRFYLGPGARCELPAGHEAPHRRGLLLWYDPPLFVLGDAVPFRADMHHLAI